MQEVNKQVLVTIIVAVILLIFIAVIMLILTVYYSNHKKKLIREKEVMQSAYEQTILKSQIEIQEQTLKNISQEIHDNIGQILSLVSLNLYTLHTTNPEKLSFTEELLTKAITDLRDLSKSLNTDRVGQIGIQGAIEHDLKLLEKSGNYKTAFCCKKDFGQLSNEKAIILYRMAQEVINNIIKHAHATEVNVELSANETENIISISDNGSGFNLDKNSKNGIGLTNLYSRGKIINALVEIVSEEGHGTSVSFIIKKS